MSPLVVHDEPSHEFEDVRRYVELEARGHRVKHAECLKREILFGREHQVWDVVTSRDRFWVVTGPTNLYSHRHFPSADYALSFHVGLTMRVASRERKMTGDEEEQRSAAAWRRWQQASSQLDEAKEAEDFQAVGMRCRECLLEMIRSLADDSMVPAGQETPKRSDFNGWTALVAADVAPGSSAEELRLHLRTLAKTAWQYVNWLTHATNATRFDAHVAVESTAHVLSSFGTAVVRKERGIPDRCPSCGSYQLDSVYQPESEAEDPYVTVCRQCRWTPSPATRDGESVH